MKKNILAILFSGLVLLHSASALADKGEYDAQAVIDTLMQWWPGDYNNDRQVADLKAAAKPIWMADDSGKGGHIQVESHYRELKLPAFGKHVLYVEEFKHGDPTNIFRQRLYSFSADQESKRVRVKLWYFNDKKKYIGAWKDLARLNELSPDEMFALPDSCDLLVAQQGQKYHMSMQDRACVFGEKYFNYQVLLGPNSFWFRDKINLVADDSLVSTAGDFTYHQLDRLGAAVE